MKSVNQKKIPRGIRNNNPLNIRIGNTWLGEVPNPTDSDFEQFVAVQYGLRAGFCILRRYIRRYGRNTIRKIVSAWAPSNENNTQSYIDFVSQFAHLSADTPISYEDKPVLCLIVQGMCKQEVGQVISMKVIESAYDIA